MSHSSFGFWKLQQNNIIGVCLHYSSLIYSIFDCPRGTNVKLVKNKKEQDIVTVLNIFSLLAGTVAISLGYAIHQFSYHMSIIKPYSIHQSFTKYSSF